MNELICMMATPLVAYTVTPLAMGQSSDPTTTYAYTD